jgi:hypothetical protein
VWADFGGTLGKVVDTSGTSVNGAALKEAIRRAQIVTVHRGTDGTHPTLVVEKVENPADAGSSLTLDALRDVSAPASTPVGKVLGTTATGVWGPVDAATGGGGGVSLGGIRPALQWHLPGFIRQGQIDAGPTLRATEVYYVPMTVRQPWAFDVVTMQPNTVAAPTKVSAAIYSCSAAGTGLAKVFNVPEQDFTAAAQRLISVPRTELPPGHYLVAVSVDADLQFRAVTGFPEGGWVGRETGWKAMTHLVRSGVSYAATLPPSPPDPLPQLAEGSSVLVTSAVLTFGTVA